MNIDPKELAAEILAGEYPSGPWLTTFNYTPAEWMKEAQRAVELDDYDDIADMIQVETAHQSRDYMDDMDRAADEGDYRYECARDKAMEREMGL